MVTSRNLYAGLDIGGTKTAAILVDAQGNLLAQTRLPTDVRHADGVVASATTAVYSLLQQVGATPAQLGGLGVGVPGQVDPVTGMVSLAANLNLADFPLGPALADCFQTPVTLENDVRLAAVGVYHQRRRQGQAAENLAYVSIGTGIAAGLVLHGRLYRGSHGMAGEIGHMIVERDGRRCNCGARGCLETIVAGPAIVAQALTEGFLPPEPQAAHAGHVYQAAAAGDPIAQAIIDQVSDALALALQWLIFTYDVANVVLGGGVTTAGAAFLTPTLNALARLRVQSRLLAALLPANKFSLLPHEDNPGPWGAVLSVLPDTGLATHSIEETRNA